MYSTKSVYSYGVSLFLVATSLMGCGKESDSGESELEPQQTQVLLGTWESRCTDTPLDHAVPTSYLEGVRFDENGDFFVWQDNYLGIGCNGAVICRTSMTGSYLDLGELEPDSEAPDGAHGLNLITDGSEVKRTGTDCSRARETWNLIESDQRLYTIYSFDDSLGETVLLFGSKTNERDGASAETRHFSYGYGRMRRP